MNENVENLILVQLREMRGEMTAMRADMASMRAEMTAIRADIRDLDQKTDGIALMLTMLAGHVHAIDGRVERLEARLA